MAEVRPDQRTLRKGKRVGINRDLLTNFLEAAQEQLLRLPVTLAKIGKDAAELTLGSGGVERQNILDQAFGAAARRRLRLPAQMKWSQDDAGGIGFKPFGQDLQRAGCLASWL